jgi:hypothetical protein
MLTPSRVKALSEVSSLPLIVSLYVIAEISLRWKGVCAVTVAPSPSKIMKTVVLYLGTHGSCMSLYETWLMYVMI